MRLPRYNRALSNLGEMILLMRIFLKTLSCALLTLAFAPVFAADENGEIDALESSRTTFSGFGTIGGVYNSIAKEAGFARTINQGDSTLGQAFSMRPDSRIGVQVNHRLTPELSLTGQLVLRDQDDNNLNKVISRAFVHWRASPDLRIRFGRFGDATYLMSDYQDVGYAYPWARPIETTYGILPIHHFDGVETSYNLPGEASAWRVKGLIGKINSDIFLKDDVSYDLQSDGPAFGFALIREEEASKIWLGYATFKLKKDNESESFRRLKNGLEQTGSAVIPGGNPFTVEANELLEEISYKGKRIGYLSFGASFDNGLWVLQSEFSKVISTSRPFKASQAYLSAGYRFGNLMPYATIGVVKGSQALTAQTNFAQVNSRPFGPFTPPNVEEAINAFKSNGALAQQSAVSAINSTIASQKMFSLGARWDFHPQAALKLQWDHFRIRENGYVMWRVKDFAVQEKARAANVISLNLDFIF